MGKSEQDVNCIFLSTFFGFLYTVIIAIIYMRNNSNIRAVIADNLSLYSEPSRPESHLTCYYQNNRPYRYHKIIHERFGDADILDLWDC